MDNFESLSSGRPNLIQSEPIQPVECRLDVLLSPKLLHKILCVALSQLSRRSGQTHEDVLALLAWLQERG
jgi:hypothetical protein